MLALAALLGTIVYRDRYFDLFVWYDEASRVDRTVIGQTILDTPSGGGKSSWAM